MKSHLIKTFKISEKAAMLAEQGKYVVLVDRGTTAPEIKKAVKAQYGVTAVSVNVANRKGKVKRHGKTTHRRPTVRTAIVTLAEGQSIDIATQQ